MEDEKKSLWSMMFINAIVGIVTVFIVKSYKPEYCSISGIVTAILKTKELVTIVYIVLVLTFIIFSYVLAIISINIIGAMTIGRVINFIKEIFGAYKDDSKSRLVNYERYSYTDVALIAIYIFIIEPILLYMLWPALSVILIIILIIVAIGSC